MTSGSVLLFLFRFIENEEKKEYLFFGHIIYFEHHAMNP